jgi:hypothetical protein
MRVDEPGLIRVIPVDFVGEGDAAAEAPLTWAQVDHWKGIVEAGQAATMGAAHRMPTGSTIDEVAELLRFIVSRHQALRTRLRFEENGVVSQVCSATGTLDLQVVDAGAADPDEFAGEWTTRLRQQPFDFERDWPVRMAVITVRDEITHVVTVYLHLAIDAGGLNALLADVAERDSVTGAASGPVTSLRPLELARRQSEPAALRRSTSALRHLEHVMNTVNPAMLGRARRSGPADYRAIRFRSPATALALERVAAEQAVTSATAMLAAYAVGLARHLQESRIWAMVLVGNRFRPGFGDSISLLVQSSPVLVDVAGISLTTAVIRARAGLLNTYKNAYYSPGERDSLIAKLNRDRPEPIELGCYYNDRRDERPANEQPVTAAQLGEAVRHGSWSEDFQHALPRMTLFVNVDESPGAIDFPISFDSRYFEVDEVVALARGIEAAAVEIALAPDTPTGLSVRVGQQI